MVSQSLWWTIEEKINEQYGCWNKLVREDRIYCTFIVFPNTYLMFYQIPDGNTQFVVYMKLKYDIVERSGIGPCNILCRFVLFIEFKYVCNYTDQVDYFSYRAVAGYNLF